MKLRSWYIDFDNELFYPYAEDKTNLSLIIWRSGGSSIVRDITITKEKFNKWHPRITKSANYSRYCIKAVFR